MGELRTYSEFQDVLRDLDVSDEDQLDLFDTLDVDGGGTIDLHELILGIRKLRGDARRSDIVGVGLIVRSIQSALTKFEESTMEALQNHSRALRNLQAHTGMRGGSDMVATLSGTASVHVHAVQTTHHHRQRGAHAAVTPAVAETALAHEEILKI